MQRDACRNINNNEKRVKFISKERMHFIGINMVVLNYNIWIQY